MNVDAMFDPEWRCTCDCHADGDENCYGCCRGKCTTEGNIWKEKKEPDDASF